VQNRNNEQLGMIEMTEVLQELEKLSISERLLLVEELWDSIARCNANVPVPQWQKKRA